MILIAIQTLPLVLVALLFGPWVVDALTAFKR